MKKKEFKKLSLNKETVVKLNNEEMNEVKGGNEAKRTRVICGTSRGATICISLISCAHACKPPQ